MSDTAPIQHPTWLTSGDFTEADEPFRLFQTWFDEAVKSEPRDPNAMSLATVDPDGMPDVRTVLLKGIDERGFVFYTNTESQKGQELAANPKAGLLFYWKSLNRQVRVRGPVERVTPEEADVYFATRPKGAQIGAWASQQSRPLESRLAFEKAGRALRCEIRAGRRAAPAALVRLSHRAAEDRVLARPPIQTT
jgi:pyridoxamine 5'-phosphate oxidase